MTIACPRRLIDLRRDQALSIRALAARANVSSRTIQRMEQGQPVRIDAVARLAVALGVEPMAIVEYVEQRRRDNETAGQD